MTTRWTLAGLIVAAVVLVSLPLVTGRTGAEPGSEAGAAGPLPGASACEADRKPATLDLTLSDMDGRAVNLADYKGKAILLNFWATWCGPCKVEIPAFIALQEQYRDRGFVVLGVSTDDPPEALRAFAAEHKMNYPVLQANDAIMDAYGPIWAIPQSFFIRTDGTICKKHMGPATKDEFEADVKALF